MIAVITRSTKESPMMLSVRVRQSTVALAVGGAAVAGALFVAGAPTAFADPPGCTAGDLAQTAAGVSSATASYLFAHPDVNAYFSSLRGQPRDAIRDQISNYLNANPQTRDDLHGIRQPLIDMRNRCGPFVAGGPGGPGMGAPPGTGM
jgi:hemophore-related protein